MKKVQSRIGIIFLGSVIASISRGNPYINEMVCDPQTDRNGDGIITGSDEFFEIFNPNDYSVDLTNWRLELIDTTLATNVLKGTILPHGYFSVCNPPGEQNNSGELRLFDNYGNLVDDMIYGNWPGSTIQDANSTSITNESLSRLEDGRWIKTIATPGRKNEIWNNIFLNIQRIGGDVSISATNAQGIVLQRGGLDLNWKPICTNVEAQLIYNEKISTNATFFKAYK